MKKRIIVTSVLLLYGLALLPLTAGAEEEYESKKGTARVAPREAAVPMSLSVETGLGYDSNPYLAPGSAYNDYYQPGAPRIYPQRHPGFFVPLSVRAKYNPELNSGSRFLASYSFNGDIYLESETENANTYSHKVKAGMEFVLEKKDRLEDTLYFGPFVTSKRRIYFDRDYGVDKTTRAGVDISNRYTYRSIGVEAEFKKRTTPLHYGLKAEAEQLDFEDPVEVSEYDHTYYLLGGDVDFGLAKPTRLNLSYEYRVRDYSDRHARNANGQLFASAPLLQYTYHDIGVTLRNRLAKGLVVYLDYDRITRTDEYVGYNDYTENEYRIRVITREDRGTKLRVALTYWKRDYPDAFAFDRFGQPRKKYDGVEADVKGDLALAGQWGLWTEYKYWNQNSSDLRYDYTRYQLMAGVKWEY